MDLPDVLGACFEGIGPDISCTFGRLPPFLRNVNPMPSLMLTTMHGSGAEMAECRQRLGVRRYFKNYGRSLSPCGTYVTARSTGLYRGEIYQGPPDASVHMYYHQFRSIICT